MKRTTKIRRTLRQTGLIRTPGAPKPRAKDLWLVGLWLGSQLAVYFGTRVVNAGREHYQLETAWDRAIPLVPAFALVYVASYVYWAAGFALLSWDSRRTRLRTAAADLVLNTLCLGVFLALPTTMTRPELTGDGFWSWALGLIYRADTPDNLLPSLHCAVSWLCWRAMAGCSSLRPWVKRAALVFTLLVCASVVLVKQHCLIDIPTGLLAAEVSWRLGGLLTRGQEE